VRGFLPDTAYSAIADSRLRVVRKADGTGFFMFPPEMGSATEPAATQYRLEMTYHRDNLQREPASQVFSQAGGVAPETVRLDIPWQILTSL
jgi:hypothetical protein